MKDSDERAETRSCVSMKYMILWASITTKPGLLLKSEISAHIPYLYGVTSTF